MEKKNEAKISLSSLFLILAIIVIVIMGMLIYQLNNDKLAEIQKSQVLQSQVNSLNTTINNLQGKIDSISQTINSSSNNSTSNTSTTQNSNSNSSSSSTTVKLNAKDYEGKWSIDNEEISIKAINNNTISFTYIVESAYSERVASIQIDNLNLDENGFGKFNFEGDGFGIDGNGNGTISLSQSKVTINIERVNMGEDNRIGWTIGEGQRVFDSKE